MRGSVFGLVASVLVLAAGCRSTWSERSQPERKVDEGRAPTPSAAPPGSRAAIVALERELQTTRLSLPPRYHHLPRLVFGAGVVGRLRDRDLQVLDERTLMEVALLPLEQPRALIAMADGALVAVGTAGLVRWEPDKPVAPTLARPVLFPGAELYPDARWRDRLWVVQADSDPPKLYGYRLADDVSTGLLVPEQTIELKSRRGGTFGVTREGVWLYVTAGRVERLAPSGLALPSLSGPSKPPLWALSTRRLDQSVWVDEPGTLTRTLVSPVFKPLARARNPGATYAAEVGDEGRLLALIAVTGPGPRLELGLFDGELRERGRTPLPAESPTGGPDWVREVTRNQELAVAPRDGRVAVGGPDRLTIYDGSARPILAIPIE